MANLAPHIRRGPVNFPKLEPDIHVRDQWAKAHLEYTVKESLLARFPNVGLPFDKDDGEHLPPLTQDLLKDHLKDSVKQMRYLSLTPATKIANPKVAIVGAGAAGLFAAMILDYLNLKVASFNVDYDILEAAEKERVGGRLFTYEFKPAGASNPQGPHDYYDVGAMRFPENKVMARLFSLFDHLDMKKTLRPLETLRPLDEKPAKPVIGSLIPYYLQNIDNGKVKEPWRFNTISKFGGYESLAAAAQTDDPAAPKNDPFHLNDDSNWGNSPDVDNSYKFAIPDDVLGQSPDKTLNGAIEVVRSNLKDDLNGNNSTGNEGFNSLQKFDNFSTRQFLAVSQQKSGAEWGKKSWDTKLPPFNYETVEFLETFNGGTNWYDQAHSETVLESLDFEYDDNDDIKWYAILGGAKQLAIRMEDRLANKPEYLSRVTAIKDSACGLNLDVDITRPACAGDTVVETRTYHAVFNSTTLGALKRINTDGVATLGYTTRQAIRSLGYGPSAKVGIKFSRPWWIHDLGHGRCIKKGGQGHSDLSIRTCVYPSYNIDDPDDQPAVLLCSYTWQQDAERLGALFSTSKDHDQQLKDEAALRELLLRDLARLHSYPDAQGNPVKEEDMYNLIAPLYLDHYAHDWTHDPNTAGAFAFFRPQQFSCVWTKIICPIASDLFLIGEATSPHHAWVVGALESAVHGIDLWLSMHGDDIEGASEALALLEEKDDGVPFVGLPPYMSKELAQWIALNAHAQFDT